MIKYAKQMNDFDWRLLRFKYIKDRISTKKLIDKTRGQDRCPEWWDFPCECNFCVSYAAKQLNLLL